MSNRFQGEINKSRSAANARLFRDDVCLRRQAAPCITVSMMAARTNDTGKAVNRVKPQSNATPTTLPNR